MTRELLDALAWRCIGPHRGGRVVAVAGDPRQPAVFYFGSTGGGVWRTDDAGNHWHNCSDGFFRRASVGALAVAPSDSNVIYAGMGESTIRGNVSHGDGVYKSTDGGDSWRHLGLERTRNIGKVRVHPSDPNTVYVAAFGHAHGPNPERGLYRSLDGGETWENILFVSERAGVNDLSIDPQNPRLIFASSWEAERGAHYMRSGGPGSHLFRSTDGGDSWKCLDEKAGLPQGIKGKIGVAVSPARSGRVWAIIEHEDGGVFRSDDRGDTWERVNSYGELRERAWYYSHIIADPLDPDTVWVLNLKCWKSIDGGRTFASLPTPHVDNHDLWIDPANPRRLILGCDGGAAVSHNGGQSWSSVVNQPTAEFYHVTTDTRMPYRVYGAQQDNSTISLPSRSNMGFISSWDWYRVGGGESGYIAVRPDDPDIVYAGDQQGRISRYNHRSGESADISIWPEHYWGMDAKDRKYRFAWTFPLVLSPHDPNILYAGCNHVFRTNDEGRTWEEISLDLTRNDPERLQPLGRVGENANGDVYGTIFTIAESPVQRGLIWTGSDDGRVHVSNDDGRSWEDVTPETLPEWTLISLIEPSAHDAGTAYVAAERHKLDDFRPYIYKTTDFGKSWTCVTDGIGEDDFVHAVREDPEREGLLYAGTEGGLCVSFDGGGQWQRLGGDFPVVPVHDLVVKGGDLVVATHGRAFWILDDLTVLRRWTDEVAGSPAYLFPPRPTPRWIGGGGAAGASAGRYSYGGSGFAAYTPEEQPDGGLLPVYVNAGTNPPNGVSIHYWLNEPASAPVTLAIVDEHGATLREFSSDGEGDRDRSGKVVPTGRGLNRFIWDMRLADPTPVATEGGDRMNARGPRLVPGRYTVCLSIGEQTFTEELEILPDPRISSSQDELVAQFELLSRINAKLSETNEAINQIRSIRGQVDDWMARVRGSDGEQAVPEAGAALKERLASIEAELIQTEANSMEDTLRLPAKLNAKLAWLNMTVGDRETPPTAQHYELFDDLAGRVDRHLERLRALVAADVVGLSQRLREASVPHIVPH